MWGFALISGAAAPLAAAWLVVAVTGYRVVMLLVTLLGVLSWMAFALARAPRR